MGNRSLALKRLVASNGQASAASARSRRTAADAKQQVRQSSAPSTPTSENASRKSSVDETNAVVLHDHDGTDANDYSDPTYNGNCTISVVPNASDDNQKFHYSSASTKREALLTPHPFLDSLALLILLLHLPATLLTTLHLLFACLMFVAPNASSSASATSNFISQGTSAPPSLPTVLLADASVALISAFLLPQARGFIVDLAQAVIATALGGGGFRAAAMCAGVVGGARIARSKMPYRMTTIIQPTDSALGWLMSTTPFDAPGMRQQIGAFTWIQDAIAVHVVGQGVMRALRRWILDGSVDAASTTSNNGKKEKDIETNNLQVTTTNSKKKKGSSLRSMPLWNVIAGALVFAAKEAELRPQESPSSNEEVVWVTSIDSGSVSFSISFGDRYREEHPPLTVRVNGILWTQTTFEPLTRTAQNIHGDEGDEGNGVEQEEYAQAEKDGSVWLIRVSGLASVTEYEFEISLEDDLICRASICTSPKQAALAQSQPQAPARPFSPLTTLLSTVETASASLQDLRQRLRRVRRDNSKHLSSLRSEIDTLRNRVSNGDKGDERAWRRVLFLREFVRRTEDEAIAMEQEKVHVEAEHKEVSENWTMKKKEWEAEMATLSKAEEEVKNARMLSRTKLDQVEGDKTIIMARKDKLLAKKARLNAELERLQSSERDMMQENGREIRRLAREERQQRRQALELEFVEAIDGMQKGVIDLRSRVTATWQQLQGYGVNGLQSDVGMSRPMSPPLVGDSLSRLSPGFPL
ncbi:hypothetical protein SAICODRAFT_20786 [Saitoella complicata NRRL Y-17804]|uniref:uncharacterized protein n=1 Tax=Saitoella complicata (strain BCRC 22490 / CBS 7301 / JCM 7358 / NBRC 10748 / NRRL Y-17804) TaxID=698492 RepID=UPI000867D30D|nr:uncharacterized protein SAICODRAFT_20786 [Saitoella complicata NRRL Y-17804]ODQ51422.1 hypothetical protein SAICODRAFT_20786 [Saitoella complicata NRRL Y-17804]